MRPLRPAVCAAALVALAACSSTPPPATSGTRAVPTSSAAVTVSPATPTTVPPAVASSSPAAAASRPMRSTAASSTSAPAPRTGGRVASTARAAGSVRRLPVPYPTGSARQVITVVAARRSSTVATLQAWERSGSGWRAVGPSTSANLGTDGSTTHPSESLSATPIGSFTLTRAFGHDADPGTALPYTRTSPDDWWVSQAGALYNTFQQCSSHCPFTLGDPNEHLYYETPAYDHAVVIDYNTANAPGGVKQGAGSAFFLHVSEGEPTAGCVSIPAADLVRIMRWLEPAAHPRILIGS